MLQTSLLLMKSLNNTETSIFLSVVCSLFLKAIFLMFILFQIPIIRQYPDSVHVGVDTCTSDHKVNVTSFSFENRGICIQFNCSIGCNKCQSETFLTVNVSKYHLLFLCSAVCACVKSAGNKSFEN